MDKTAREVIVDWYNDEGCIDSLISRLDAAGFAIVRKEPTSPETQQPADREADGLR